MKIQFPPQSKDGFVHTFLTLLSSVQPLSTRLTDVELLVLKAFLLLPPKFKYQAFSSAGRTKVTSYLAPHGITRSNVNNRLYSLIRKGYIRRDKDKVLYINEKLQKVVSQFITTRSATLTFTFQLDDSIEDRSFD